LSLKWNGKKLDNFAPSRGLRQGDPMSPYLFVLCMEKLSLLIQQKIRLVMEVLEAFCGASGLKVNVHKTHIMTSKHVSTIKVNRFAAISQFQHTRQIGKYMGFPMLTGRVRNSDFNYILEKINSRLAGWKMKLLNRAGRVTLANSVLTTMPVY
ncbi:Putative ribonuclease H protein, partial [Glycine soja]